MYICPLCNSLENRQEECPRCKRLMDDRGRIIDYFDAYSAYLDIEGMKNVDGYENDKENHQCPHIFYCTQCGFNRVLLIQEKDF